MNMWPTARSPNLKLGRFSDSSCPDLQYKCCATLIWNETGDRLAIVGEQLTLFDYPAAKNIQIIQMPKIFKSGFFQGDNLYLMSTGADLIA